jgi:hypothetical protein
MAFGPLLTPVIATSYRSNGTRGRSTIRERLIFKAAALRDQGETECAMHPTLIFLLFSPGVMNFIEEGR